MMQLNEQKNMYFPGQIIENLHIKQAPFFLIKEHFKTNKRISHIYLLEEHV